MLPTASNVSDTLSTWAKAFSIYKKVDKITRNQFEISVISRVHMFPTKQCSSTQMLIQI